VKKLYLPTLSEIIALGEQELLPQPLITDDGIQPNGHLSAGQQADRAERRWYGAIAALNTLLRHSLQIDANSPHQATDGFTSREMQGIVLSGPSTVLQSEALTNALSSWVFATHTSPPGRPWPACQLLPAAERQAQSGQDSVPTLPLLPDDPITAERFCLVLTADFSLVMSLGQDASDVPVFLFSFAPEIVWRAWRSLRSRLMITSPLSVSRLDDWVEHFSPVMPDYRTVMQFSQLMLTYLPEPSDYPVAQELDSIGRSPLTYRDTQTNLNSTGRQKLNSKVWHEAIANDVSSSLGTSTVAMSAASPLAANGLPHRDAPGVDVELLQAIAHEVRTPLTTIRTMTRLLLKRKELSPDVVKRLRVIDEECTKQIDRFNLIFRAVELETAGQKAPATPLASTSLAQVFQDNVPYWQQQASQRNVSLEVTLPPRLPTVVSDPVMLYQVLTGLMDHITHSLPAGSQLQLKVMLAGSQLKLQFQAKQTVDPSNNGRSPQFQPLFSPSLKSIGELLMFQPETGNLSLNLSVTKNLFQVLGGKMIVRQRLNQGEVLTIFLPLETRQRDLE
jgi:signal transduction histidine kinase